MKIEKTNDMVMPKLNLLVHGAPGMGKTRFAGTAINGFKPLILSAESGLLSLKKLGNFDYIKIDNFDRIVEAREHLRYAKHNYDTVIMDSITEIQQVCMDKILQEEKRPKAMIQDWGTLNNRMVAMIRDFRDMNLNFLVTALSETTTDEESGTTRLGPLVQGKLRDTLAGYFDEVFYIFSKSSKGTDGKQVTSRYLQTVGTDKVIAKDRSGELPSLIQLQEKQPDDFKKIYDMIFGSKESK